MATNRYIDNFTYDRTQDLVDDIVVEAIKMYGIDVQYMPRTVYNEDRLFGEDPASLFSLAVVIEMYVNNITGTEGEGDLLSKFGFEIRDTLKLTVSRKRWSQIRTEKLVDEDGYNIQDESANTGSFANTSAILPETASANGYSIASSRPMEGDLIFIPFINRTGAVYEIKHVNQEQTFYQMGDLYTYELSCDKFKFSSERFNTGNTIIDSIETRFTADAQENVVLGEDNTNVLDEDGSYLVQEYRLETTVATANNEWIRQKSATMVDWSEQSPFGEQDRR